MDNQIRSTATIDRTTGRPVNDIFISYSRRDKEFARQLDAALRADGRDPWVDWQDIPPTVDWQAEIYAGIDNADSIVFIITPDSLKSEYTYKEVEHALQNHKRFIPILRASITNEQRDAFHPALAVHNWIDFREPIIFEEAYALLKQAVDTDFAHVRAHTRLLVRAREWEEKARNPSMLLRGSDLSEAETWLAGATSKNPAPADIHAQYIRESRRATTRRQIQFAVGTLVSLVITVLAVLAIYQGQLANQRRAEAEDARAEAEAQRGVAEQLALAAGSQVVLTNRNTDLALLLALEANARGASALTERALAEAAYAPGAIQALTGPERGVLTVAVAEDDNTVVGGGADGQIYVWALDSGDILRQWAVGAPVISLDIHPDGSSIISGAENGAVCLWDMASGAQIRCFENASTARVRVARFSPDGQYALSSDSNRLHYWDVTSGTLIRTLSGHNQVVLDVDFSSDGTQAISSGGDMTLRLWDLSTGEEQRVYRGHTGWVTGLDIAPNGERVVSSSADFTLRVWDIGTGDALLELEGHSDYIFDAVFSPDGAQILSASSDNSLLLWDASTGLEQEAFNGHGARVRQVVFLSAGQEALSASEDGTVRHWDLFNGAAVGLFDKHPSQVNDLAISPDGTQVLAATGGSRGSGSVVVMWDIATQERIRSVDDHSGAVSAVAFSPDGTRFASGDQLGEIVLRDADGTNEGEWLAHEGRVADLAFTPDGSRLLSVGWDNRLRIWDAATGEALLTLDGTDSPAELGAPRLNGIAVHPDGTRALTVSLDRDIVMWDILTGEQVWVIGNAHGDWINSVGFSPDGSTFITGGDDNVVFLWDTATQRQLLRFDGHSGPVWSVAFSPDGTKIASASGDKTVRIWDVTTGLEVRRFGGDSSGHQGFAVSVAFMPDGREVISGSYDRTLIQWQILELDALRQWALNNRHLREPTCYERLVYQLPPLCESGG